MFASQNDQGYRTVLPKVSQKTLVHGDNTLMVEFHLTVGGHVPRHAHPHEQTGYLVSGSIRLDINDTTHEVCPGDSWVIGANLPHSAECLEDAVIIEVFSPVREDYLPANAV